MTREAFRHERAALYDRIYHFKDYVAEAQRLRAVLAAYGVGEGARVLDAACGTGVHLEALRQWYDVAGFDLDAGMLAQARARLGAEATLFEADMAALALAEHDLAPFDALLVLFSSLGYLAPGGPLEAAAGAFYRALAPGGVALVEPFVTPEAFRPGAAIMQTYDDDDVKLCRATVPERHGDRAELAFHWLVVRPDVGVEHFVEHHTLWLVDRERLLAVFRDAGFVAVCCARDDELGRELLVARRPR